MAYISVHDSIFGPKLRDLAGRLGCSQNEAIGILVRLWFFGLRNADRDGMLLCSAKKDVTEAIRPGLVSEDDTESLNEDAVYESLIKSRWLEEEDGQLYLSEWVTMQSEFYAAKEKREREAARKREKRRMARMLQNPEPEPEAVPEELPEPEPDPEPEKAADPPEKKAVRKQEYTNGFEAFWEEYPRKKGKGEAYAKYKARLNDGWTEEQLLQAARAYKAECSQLHTAEKYIKHGKTFLSSDTPFSDYLQGGGVGVLNSTGRADEVEDVMEKWKREFGTE